MRLGEELRAPELPAMSPTPLGCGSWLLLKRYRLGLVVSFRDAGEASVI
jgi:hypothetical protein